MPPNSAPTNNTPKEKPNPLAGALTLMGGTLASRITGLLRSSLLNQLFTKEISDAFLVAAKIPNLFRELLAEGALTNAFVPIYKKCDAAERKVLAGSVLAILLCLNALLLALIWWLAPWVVDVLIGAGDFIDRELTIKLTRLAFPFLTAISLSAWAMGILQAEEYFLAPAWAPVAFNVVTISLMLTFPNQALWLALAFSLAGFAQLLLQLPALRKHKLLPRWQLRPHPRLWALVMLMLPFLFTTSGRQILNVISNRLLNTISAGAVTAFFNADLFLSLALGLFSISPALAYYSRLADDVKNAPEQFKLTLLEGLRFISFLTIPASVLLIVFAEPVIQVVFNWLPLLGGQGADSTVLALSQQVLAPLGLAVFPIGLNNLLMRSFYVHEEVRLPVGISLIFLSLQAGLYLWLTPWLGIAGLAWATVIIAWLQLISLLIILQKAQRLESRTLIQQALKLWGLAALLGTVGYGILKLITITQWWGYVALSSGGILLFIFAYALGAHLLAITELSHILRRLPWRRWRR